MDNRIHQVVFDDAKHEYWYEGKRLNGITGTISDLLGKKFPKTDAVFLATVLGSDVHREKGTYLIIPETIKKIKKIVGESKLQELTTINPQKILELLEDENKWNNISRNSLESVKKYYSDNVAKEWIKIIEK